MCVQVLRDTSYQRKYNVRPVQLDELDAGLVHVKSEPAAEEVQGDSLQHLSEAAAPGLPCQSGELSERFEPVLSLALQQLRRDVDNTCSVLGISPGQSQIIIIIIL